MASSAAARQQQSTQWQHYCDFLRSKGNIEAAMVVSSEDAGLWGHSPSTFYLREYGADIEQEDGTTVSTVVNEAKDLIEIINDRKPAHGLRISAGPKQQILRAFKDDETGLYTVYGKFMQGGSCIANAGKCTIIATYSEGNGHKSAGCNEVVSLMARYLNKSIWPSPETKQLVSEADGAITWQPYIDAMLVGKGNVAEALICSKSDCSAWASTPNFSFETYESEIPQEDGSDVVETVDEAKNMLTLMSGVKPSQGLRVHKTKYQILRQFEDSLSGCYTVYGKKARGGVCIIATNRSIVVGTFDENSGHSSTACNEAMADFGKFMLSKKL